MFRLRTITFYLAVIYALIGSAGFAMAEDDLSRGAAVYKKCAACHELEKPRNKMGPHLNGLVGRQAGTVSGYKYSQAMIDAGAAGLIWDRENLHEFISSPKKKVPGTSMRFFGLWSDSDIDDVIAYIGSIPPKTE